jgi:hypothetical protein
MDETLNESMHDDLNDQAGIQVQELEAEASPEPVLPDPNQRWHGQLRRNGSARELPAPQPYGDYPTWLTEPHKNPAFDLEEVSV